MGGNPKGGREVIPRVRACTQRKLTSTWQNLCSLLCQEREDEWVRVSAGRSIRESVEVREARIVRVDGTHAYVRNRLRA